MLPPSARRNSRPKKDMIYLLKGGDPKWFVIEVPVELFPP